MSKYLYGIVIVLGTDEMSRELADLIHDYDSEISITVCDSLSKVKSVIDEDLVQVLITELSIFSREKKLLRDSFENMSNLLTVFVSTDESDAIQSYNMHGVSFMLYPFQKDQVEKSFRCLQRIIALRGRKLVEENSTVSFISKGIIPSQADDKYYLVKLDDVIYFCVENGKVTMKTKDSVYNVKYSLSALEDILDNSVFMRCQKSYIINLNCIKVIDAWFNQTFLLTMEGASEKIPVSRMYYKKFKELLS